MEKVKFALDIKDGWPPVASENVWCEKDGDNYKIVNAPFFIFGLAFGDIFKATPDEVNEHIFEFEVVKESGHSLVWILNNIDLDMTQFKEELQELGCLYEGFQRFSLYAIDIPTNVDKYKLNKLIDKYEEMGLDFAFPVWRHEIEST